MNGNKNMITFESKKDHGYYLTFDENNDWICTFGEHSEMISSKTIYSNNISYKVIKEGLADRPNKEEGIMGSESLISFESAAYPGRYLRHRNFCLHLDIKNTED